MRAMAGDEGYKAVEAEVRRSKRGLAVIWSGAVLVWVSHALRR
jgi:hypothetical protein